jgi:hypothetical protein
MTGSTLARRTDQGLAVPGSQEPIVQPLSKYRPPVNGLMPAVDVSTIDALATISAGKKTADGNPIATKTIQLHDPDGLAPGLKERLEERHYESLVIGFAWNDSRKFLRQRMAAYGSNGALRIVGPEDGSKLIVFASPMTLSCPDQRCQAKPNEPCKGIRGFHVVRRDRREVSPADPTFDKLWSQCAPETWVYFHGATWDPEEGPSLEWLDNTFTPYRLRFTSTNSRYNLDACLRGLRELGQIAFMPIKISIQGERPVVLPNGQRGKAPVWRFDTLTGPEGSKGLRISARFLEMRDLARRQSNALALPEPSEENINRGLESLPAIDEVEVERLVAGPCNAVRWNKVFHRLVANTHAGTDAGRHRFIDWHTRRHPDLAQTASLREFLQSATEDQAARMIDELLDALDRAGQRDAGTGEVIDVTPAAANSSMVVADSNTAPPPGAVVEVDASAGPPAAGASSDSPPPAQAVEAMCANCDTRQLCQFDGETYICVDEQDCRERSATAAMALGSDDNEDDPDGAEEDVSSDEQEATEWVRGLQERMAAYALSAEPSTSARLQELGKVLTAAAGSTRGALRLLEVLTADAVHKLGDATRGHTEVILQASYQQEEWTTRIGQLKRSLGMEG